MSKELVLVYATTPLKAWEQVLSAHVTVWRTSNGFENRDYVFRFVHDTVQIMGIERGTKVLEIAGCEERPDYRRMMDEVKVRGFKMHTVKDFPWQKPAS